MALLMSNTSGLLFSFLIRQRLFLQGRFASRYPHDWLVWEASSWRPAPPSGTQARTLEPERFPTGPRRDDALCFPLPMDAGKPVRLGRALENDVVLDDVSVSRRHLIIVRDAAGAWVANAPPDSGPSQLAGAPIPAALVLVSGVTVYLGDLPLTFHSSASFVARVEAASAKHLRA